MCAKARIIKNKPVELKDVGVQTKLSPSLEATGIRKKYEFNVHGWMWYAWVSACGEE